MIAKSRAFVTAADETWRLQRGDDAECRAFQSMANGGHYGGGGGGTRQGLYVVAPSNALLAAGNTLSADAALALMERGLSAFDALPAEARALPAELGLAPAHRWEWSFPERGLALRRVVRDLPESGLPDAAPRTPSNRDAAWFSAGEIADAVPPRAAVGEVFTLPAPLARRLAQLSLVDNVRGQVLPFADEEVERAELQAEVVARSGERLQLRLFGATAARSDGRWKLPGSDWVPPGEFPRRMEVELAGRATWNAATRRFDDWLLVGLGTSRGSGWLNARARDHEGRVGFLITLAPDGPGGRVPPAFIDLYAADWVTRPPQGSNYGGAPAALAREAPELP